MSKQQATQFLDRIESDANFRNQLLNASNQEFQKQVVTEANYTFSQQELYEAFNDKWNSELSQEEMQQIVAAGGSGPCPNPDILKVVSAVPALKEK